jgi:hypothetical protein
MYVAACGKIGSGAVAGAGAGAGVATEWAYSSLVHTKLLNYRSEKLRAENTLPEPKYPKYPKYTFRDRSSTRPVRSIHQIQVKFGSGGASIHTEYGFSTVLFYNDT